MRGIARNLGLVGSSLALAYWIAAIPAHDATTSVLMFVLDGIGLIGSILAGKGTRWATPLMALGAIPGVAAFLIPGLMLLAGSLIATRPAKQQIDA